jgi:hypothetical protein
MHYRWITGRQFERRRQAITFDDLALRLAWGLRLALACMDES